MYELKKIGKVFTSKFVGTGPSSYKKKRIYRTAVSQRLRNTGGKYRLLLSDFHEILTFSGDFLKILKYRISLKSVQWKSRCSMRTDKRKLIITYHNFPNAPN